MNRLAVIGFCCTAAALLSPVLAGELAPGQVEIELRPYVTAPHRAVTLGEIAYLRTTDLAAMRRLVTLSLGDAPRAGNEAVLHRESLARWMRTRAAISPEQIVWTGSQYTAVRASVQRLSSSQIHAVARATLEQWLRSRTTRFGTDIARPTQDLILPPGNVTMTARRFPINAQPTSHMTVWIDVAVDGAFVRTVPVSLQVEAYRDAWVAKSATGAGVPLEWQMVELRDVAVTAQPLALVAPERAPGGAEMQILRRLQPGEPLSEDNTRKLPAVRRGQMVALEFKGGAVQLEARAEALQEGEPGDVVRVRRAGASEAVQARVLARGRVEAMP